MPLPLFTIDTTLKHIVCNFGVTSFDVKTDLYSELKKEALTPGGDLDGFDLPIRSVAGDPIPGQGQIITGVFFLKDGWQIRPHEADHQLRIIGDLFHDDGINLTADTLGAFRVEVLVELSTLVRGVTSTQIADAVWKAVIAGFTARQRLALICAATAGKSSDGPTNPKYRDLLDTLDRIAADATAVGDRTSVTYDLTDLP